MIVFPFDIKKKRTVVYYRKQQQKTVERKTIGVLKASLGYSEGVSPPFSQENSYLLSAMLRQCVCTCVH